MTRRELQQHVADVDWWQTAGVPRGFSHGRCSSCATDVHDEHYGQPACSVDGCTCEEGERD